MLKELEQSLIDNDHNMEILRLISKRSESCHGNSKAIAVVFVIILIKLLKKSEKKTSCENEIGFHWSNHSVDYGAECVEFMNYKKLSLYSRRYKIIPVLRATIVNYIYLLKRKSINKLDFRRKYGFYFLYSFEYAVIDYLIRKDDVNDVFSFGTFCRRMLFIGHICKRLNKNHVIYQHGAFRELKGIHPTLASKVYFKFKKDSRYVDKYFIGINGTIDSDVINRDVKFNVESPLTSKYKIFFGTNPNHLEENIYVIETLLKFNIDREIIIYVSPHPRENFVDYEKKYSVNDNVVITADKYKGCDLYVFRPSTIVLEAVEEGVRPLVYVCDKDRIEQYMNTNTMDIVSGKNKLFDKIGEISAQFRR